MIAYAFLQYRRLKTARREKKNQRAAATTNLARSASGHSRTYRPQSSAARIAENGFATSSGLSKSAKVVLGLGQYEAAFGENDIDDTVFQV
jgi:hypothetical protein